MGTLREHMRVHSDLKPFECLQCGKSFARKNYLSGHMYIHTLEKRFECNECGKKFSRRQNLV